MSKKSMEILRKAGMSEADILMRINGIVALLEKNGAMTKKQVAIVFHKGESWAGTYINEGILQGKIVCTRRKFPQHFVAASTIRTEAQASLPKPSDSLQPVQVTAPGHVWKTLQILQAYYGYKTTEEALTAIVMQEANDLVISKRISLTAIEEEMQRHGEAMAKLKKGYA